MSWCQVFKCEQPITDHRSVQPNERWGLSSLTLWNAELTPLSWSFFTFMPQINHWKTNQVQRNISPLLFTVFSCKRRVTWAVKTGKERGGLCSSKRAELGGHDSAECQSDPRLHPLMTSCSQTKCYGSALREMGWLFKGTIEKIWLPVDLHPSGFFLRVNWDWRDVPWKTSEDSEVISLQIYPTPVSDSILGADKKFQ